jgi:hypothetical protein
MKFMILLINIIIMANNHELKYKLPERFHERVLKLEILIEQQKDSISHEHLKQLTELYSVCANIIINVFSKR